MDTRVCKAGPKGRVTGCLKTLPLSNFYKDRSVCKTCVTDDIKVNRKLTSQAKNEEAAKYLLEKYPLNLELKSLQSGQGLCPRCKGRFKKPGRTYCHICENEYAAEQKSGLHRKGGKCDSCNGDYPQKTISSRYCNPCRESYQERTCPTCKLNFVTPRKTSYCPPCMKLYNRERGARLKDNYKEKTYGLPPGRIKEMLKEQNNRCFLCEVDFSTLKAQDIHVDHNHTCCFGRKSCGNCVRKLLCSLCNKGLGAFKDNLEVLKKAINYLENHKL